MTDTLDPVDLDTTADAMDAPDRKAILPGGVAGATRSGGAVPGDPSLRHERRQRRERRPPLRSARSLPDPPVRHVLEEATASSFVTVTADGTAVHDDKR